MLFSSDWQIFVVLSLLKFSSIICREWCEIGTVSSMFATIGRRPYMEDTFVRIESDNGVGIYGIFDGHSGYFASSFAADFFPRKIRNEIERFSKPPECCAYIDDSELNFAQMLTKFINKADKRLKREFKKNVHKSGTTCLLVIAEERKLTVANVGDSRAVMCNMNGTAIDLSIDHKPNHPAEKQRIEEAGGRIHKHGVWRVGGLAMSRALGDHRIDLRKQIIIGEPDISIFDLDEHRPRFMILASDGLWDVISSQNAVDFIRERYSHQDDFGALELALHARDAPHGPHSPSNDNITIVIVVFKNGHYEVGSASA